MPKYGELEVGAYTIKGKYKVFKHGKSLIVDHWDAPEEDGVPVITAPNIPHALMAEGCQPRTIFGTGIWNKMRRRCYEEANDTCAVCGERPEDKRKRHSHEVHSVDYKNRRQYFVRCVCLCSRCHVGFIHSGRALAKHMENPVLFTKEGLLDAVEHGFKLVSEYNQCHSSSPLRVYDTILSYCDVPELEEEMLALIKKYKIKFYGVPDEVVKDWGAWREVINGQEYAPPYDSKEGWKEAIKKLNKEQKEVKTNPFKGEGFDLIEKLLKEEKYEVIGNIHENPEAMEAKENGA